MKQKIKTPKYISKPFWRDAETGQTFPAGSVLPKQQRDKLEYWDSALEFKVYLELRKIFPNYAIARQLKIKILSKTNVFPALTWAVDFGVLSEDKQVILLVEAKGEWIIHDKAAMADFIKLLRLLDISSPQLFNSLFIISDRTWKIGTSNLMTLPIEKMRAQLSEYSGHE